MSKTRTRKLLIDNLEQAADDLYHYLKDTATKESLLADVIEMEEFYKKPLDSWIYGMLYQHFRFRRSDIEILKNTLLEKNPSEHLIDILVDFFNKGAWESTSANTCLMLKLIEKLSDYTHENSDAFLLDPKIICRLNTLLMEKVMEVGGLKARTTLVQILEYHFNDSKVKANCVKDFNELSKKGLITRAFDLFPFSIISERESNKLIHLFIELVSLKINSEMEEISKNEENAIKQWEMQIVEMSVKYLLESPLKIKEDIINQLDWKEDINPQLIHGLLCGYIGRVNQQIMCFSKELIDQYSLSFVKICNFLNKNYGIWVTDKLNDANQSYWSLRTPAAALGVGLFISATALGTLFYRRQTVLDVETVTSENLGEYSQPSLRSTL